MGFAGKSASNGGPFVPCAVEIDDNALTVAAEGTPARAFLLTDLDDVHDDNYTLRITTVRGDKLELSMFGTGYGQLVSELTAARNSALERDLLLKGVAHQDTFVGKWFTGAEPVPVELRLYEDMLVVVPERKTMFGLPFSFIEGVEWDEALYQIRVRADEGGDFVFGHLAKRTVEFRNELTRLLDALTKRTARSIEALVPELSPDVLGRVGALMRDGRAVQKRELDVIDGAIWAGIEEAAFTVPALRSSYDHLITRTPPGWGAFGVKAVRAAPSDATPAPQASPISDLWYFCPLSRGGRPINAVAQEVISEQGHATYVFRLMDQERFDRLEAEALPGAVGAAIRRLNRALLLLNFKREPLYLSDEEILAGDHLRYAVALRKLDYLRDARGALLGRAIHNATWAEQIEALEARVLP